MSPFAPKPEQPLTEPKTEEDEKTKPSKDLKEFKTDKPPQALREGLEKADRTGAGYAEVPQSCTNWIVEETKGLTEDQRKRAKAWAEKNVGVIKAAVLKGKPVTIPLEG
jgi:hypothetical protein